MIQPTDLLWPIQLALSAMMTGIIWQIQLLTYPQFLKIPHSAFPDYHQAHTWRMAWLVMPVMVAELALAFSSVWIDANAFTVSALALVLIAWGSTGCIQVPLHNRLSNGYDEKTICSVIRTNWIRTLAWTTRTLLLCWNVAVLRSA